MDREERKAYLAKLYAEVEKEYEGVEVDTGVRWENGVDHHPRSEEIYYKLADLDYKINHDTFCFKHGGDGDNGESLMYLLDIIFEKEELDRKNLTEKDKND